MKVIQVNVKEGETPNVIEGKNCHKYAFPMHGCTHKAADAEAGAAIEQELGRTDRGIREKVVKQMEAAGTYPVHIETPKPTKLEAVPDARNTIRTEAKSGK